MLGTETTTIRYVFMIAMSIITLGEEVWAQSGAGAPTWRPIVMGKNGMVAAEHPLQALAGLRVLQNGGNAVDAAVAVFYMTAVTEPSEAGLGGDGFLLAYIKQLDRVIVINGSGGAPELATREFYQAKVGSVPPDGPYSTTVPGAVGGFDLLLKNYGTKDYPRAAGRCHRNGIERICGKRLGRRQLSAIARHAGSLAEFRESFSARWQAAG